MTWRTSLAVVVLGLLITGGCLQFADPDFNCETDDDCESGERCVPEIDGPFYVCRPIGGR
jgi:hypothetical protein